MTGERAAQRAWICGAVTVVGAFALAACAASGPARVESSDRLADGAAAPTTTSEPMFCPSSEEVEQHWEEHGEEPKPDPDCPDPDPLPSPTDPEPMGEPVDAPTTLAEAQRVYDPTNDPLVLVRKRADGSYVSILISVMNQAYVPPAPVQTSAQYARWLAALSTPGKQSTPNG